MNSAGTCDPQSLVRYLRGDLSEAEESQVVGHLDECLACRDEIERAAGSRDWWRDARVCLTPQPDAPPESSCEAEALRPAAPGAANGDLAGISLNFLGPTDDPDSLGRLGTYEIAGVVGRGGTGIVLKAFDRALHRYVAIKVLSPQLATVAA